MVELVVLACLLAKPERCETFRIPFQNEMNMVQCLWQSQIHAAEWVGNHPDWVIKRFSCQLPKA